MKTRLILLLSLCLVLFIVAAAPAKEGKARSGDKPKTLSGMSIVGNDEAPKALYIVPWKSSEAGAGIVLDMPVAGEYVPVDRDEFRRKLDYYYVGKTSDTGR